VVLQLAKDGGYRKRRERDAAGRVETIDSSEKTQRRDLDQILDQLGIGAVVTGQLPRERQEPSDQLLTRRLIPVLLPA
jgi:hypothetical protein